LAKKFEVTSFEILRNLKLLSSLKPYPASQIDSSDIRYITPDIFVYNEDDNILIVINDHWLPKIQINNEYRSLIQKKGAKASSVLKKEDMDYLGGKMNSANWLLQGIEQRRKTIYRVMEAITFYQRDFFLSGPDHLKPLSLQDVAQKLELNKSTISRITSGKYVETPFGLFELKHFFHRKMDLDHGESAIAGDIQRKIKEIIENEETPLSDQEIVTELKKWGIQIARRTVAKYREEMRILPSNLRGKNKQKII
jgi:RNA polymerase sigma-54 factor